MPENFRGRILVIRGGAIGDFILTLPAISALRRQFPEAYLEILGYPHIAQLALAGGLVDRVQSIEAGALAGFFAKNGKLSESLADYFSGFNLIISYLYDPDEIFKSNVARCSKAQFIQGPHRAKDADKIHATRVYLSPLEKLAIFDADPLPRLSLQSKGQAEALSAQAPRSPVLGLHPGSGSERKNWPEEKWAALLQELFNKTDFEILMIGGEAEGERLQRLAAALPLARLRVAQSLPLPDLGQMLARCDAYLGHDSGISHLAAALGLSGVLLWGESMVEVWRPPSEEIIILSDPAGLAALPVEQVLMEVERLWKRANLRNPAHKI
jgi:heptosyltransferase III